MYLLKKLLLITLFISLFISLFTSWAYSNPTAFQFSISQEGSIHLLWDEKDYLLLPNSKGWLDTQDQDFKTFPLEIVVPVQLMYKLHSTPSYSADEILNSLSQEFSVSKETLLQLTADAAYAMKNKSLLKELIPLATLSGQASLIYLYGSQLEESLPLKKDLLKRALDYSPH